MSLVLDEVDDSVAILEDYRATVSELRGNLKRLEELVEEQILLETPPRFRHQQSSRIEHSFPSAPAD